MNDLRPTAATSKSSSCSCPSSINSNSTTTAQQESQCPVCLGKYDSSTRIPMGLPCAHLICLVCMRRLNPSSENTAAAAAATAALPNIALLAYLDQPPVPLPHSPTILDGECLASAFALRDIALLLKSSSTLSRAVHRKVLNLITSLTCNSQLRTRRAARGVGERILIELSNSCTQLSHYQAQQQLWAAIRSRACQFMGPAMQEEALKLVLLALEDGSALSRKVLVMFVVQRLSPQFPQASKTSIGHVIQLLYRASCFDVVKREGGSSLMTLRVEYRCYESLRREHDAQIVKIGLEAGIRFSPEQWSSVLYGDGVHKPQMQSIIDRLLAPQSFAQLVTEFLVQIQRLTDPEDAAFLYSLHSHFQALSSIEVQQGGGADIQPPPTWSLVHSTLDSVSAVLIGLLTFNPKPAAKPHFQLQQSRSLNPAPTAPPTLPIHRPLLRVGGSLHLQPSRRAPLGRQHSAPAVSIAANTNSASPADPVNELLAESRVLRAKIKLLQERIPVQRKQQQMELRAEAEGLEEAACSMVQRMNV